MASGKSYVGDIGTIINVNTGEDLTTASVMELRVKKPDKSEVIWPGVLYNRKYVRYTIQDGDLDQDGIYYMQVYVEIGGWSGLGETTEFSIYKKFTR